MNITNIIYPILSIGGMGIIFGLALGFAGRIFKIEEDPHIQQVREILPGANCGACGFAGCDSFAMAVASGDAIISGCPVGGQELAEELEKIMGRKADKIEKETAYIKCAGDCEKAVTQYDYHGLDDCKAVHQLANNGPKACTRGCLGNGSCEKACAFDAINIIDGIARINIDKCTRCGLCVDQCPRNLIDIVPVSSYVRVECNTWDSGKITRENCKVGCIGCKICEKTCRFDAIKVNNNLAKVDYDKCTLCEECVSVCPTKAINVVTSRTDGIKSRRGA